ncbi:MAG: CpsB/CapC family capsule biosynthesis tyrosine phosphatase [Sphaerochaetaceae bacterium]
MIDFHTHLLYGIDDGVKDRDSSLALLREYKEAGIGRIVFTPHLYDPYVKTNVGMIRSVFEDLHRQALDMGIETYLGAELFVRHQSLKTIPVIGRYALCEMDVYSEPIGFADEIQSQLVEGQGLEIVLAHVERYGWFKPGGAAAVDLKRRGFLFQMNAASVKAGGKRAMEWLETGMIDLFATDNHGRHPGFPRCLVEACERFPEVGARMNEIEAGFEE